MTVGGINKQIVIYMTVGGINKQIVIYDRQFTLSGLR